jgi:hypothetical protein
MFLLFCVLTVLRCRWAVYFVSLRRFGFGFFFSFFVFMFLCFLFDRMRVVLDLCDVVGSLGCKGLFVLLSRKGLVVD